MRIAKVFGIIGLILAVLFVIFLITFPMISGMPVYSASHAADFSQVSTSLDQFKYQPDRITTGAVYHYTKSNIDGSRPASVSLYIASPDHFEVFKIYPNSTVTTLVTADMDWATFSPRKLTSYDVHAGGSRTLVIEGQSAPGDLYFFNAANLLWAKGKTSYAPIGHYPVHNYNFDLASLNFSFRHLVDPTQDLEIGVQMPWFDFVHIGEMEYLGKARIHYLGDEACHATQCRKYSISGEAFGQQQGYLWVNKDGGYFENAEIPVRDNPAWKDFKLELTGTEQMSAQAWDQYILSQTEAFLSK
jgi:hypothetical protein